MSAYRLHAQETESSIETLLRRADSHLALRKPAAAEELYKAALSINNASLPALIGVGRAAMAERSWSSAVDAFEHASKLYTSSLDARYYLGCAYAEYGRSRALLEKLTGLVALVEDLIGLKVQTSFEKAKSHLDWVISRDSLYRDALYQLAIRAPTSSMSIAMLFPLPSDKLNSNRIFETVTAASRKSTVRRYRIGQRTIPLRACPSLKTTMIDSSMLSAFAARAGWRRLTHACACFGRNPASCDRNSSCNLWRR